MGSFCVAYFRLALQPLLLKSPLLKIGNDGNSKISLFVFLTYRVSATDIMEDGAPSVYRHRAQL